MSWQPKRLYVYQTGDLFDVSDDLGKLAVMGKELTIGVYELVGSGKLRCDPTLSLQTILAKNVPEEKHQASTAEELAWDLNEAGK